MKRGGGSGCSQWCSASVLGLAIDNRGPKPSLVELHTGSWCAIRGVISSGQVLWPTCSVGQAFKRLHPGLYVQRLIDQFIVE